MPRELTEGVRPADPKARSLAAALEWSGVPAAGTIVTFDGKLAAAAEQEGFDVAGV